jgi:hypothetical protein
MKFCRFHITKNKQKRFFKSLKFRLAKVQQIFKKKKKNQIKFLRENTFILRKFHFAKKSSSLTKIERKTRVIFPKARLEISKARLKFSKARLEI